MNHSKGQHANGRDLKNILPLKSKYPRLEFNKAKLTQLLPHSTAQKFDEEGELRTFT